MTEDRYSFRKVTRNDLAMLAEWQARPHVREWWESDEPYTEADLASPRTRRWIVEWQGQPFAFMQDYDPHGWATHHFGHLPEGSRGIDQFIGVEAMLGRGHGSGFIAQRMRALFAAGAPVIGTDPHPENARAIAVYRKVGFLPAGPVRDTEWGLVLPMEAKTPG